MKDHLTNHALEGNRDEVVRQPRRGVAARAAFAALSLVSLSSLAAAQDDPAHRLYRCAVLGDSHACASWSPVPAERIDEQFVFGPYARYLMYLGQDPAEAIEAARSIGEAPVRRVVRVTTRELSALEKYERCQGRLVTPAETRYEVLAEEPIRAMAQKAAAQASRPKPQ